MRCLDRRAYIALRTLGQLMLTVMALVAGLLAVQPAQAQPYPVQIEPNISYGPLPAEQGDLYLPAQPAAHRPAVIIIHGGGWVSGSRHAADYFANVLASMGVVVLNIDYRLADKALPDTRWPAQLVDSQLAVRFMRAHAADYSIDTNRFGAVGDSAGAQLAVFLGELPKIVPGDEAGLYPRQAPNVKAVVDQFGPMDLPSMGNYGVGSIDAMFGTPTPPPGDLLSASPIPSVTSKSAPVYIVHGESDTVVPFDNSKQLVDALRAHRVSVELIPYAGDHAYQGLTPDQVGKLQFDAIQWLVGRLKQ